jgi:hypothetical protein
MRGRLLLGSWIDARRVGYRPEAAPRRREEDGYQTAAVCVRGHAATDSVELSPDLASKFCKQCGGEILTACPSCHSPIRGHYHVSAAEARNQIAHANPTHNAGMITVLLSKDPSKPSTARQTKPGRMELHKRTRAGKVIWTTEQLIAEYNRTDKLFGHMIALVMEFKGEVPRAHLLEP